MQEVIMIPNKLHPDTAKLVAEFATALANKLMRSQEKYEYAAEWKHDDWEDECADRLIEHVQKGDPLDVAAYAAFMWHHHWKTRLVVHTHVNGRGQQRL